MVLRSTKPDIDPVAASILQEVNDLPPIADTYAERPDDVLEVRASELEAIVTERLATFRAEFGRLRAVETRLRLNGQCGTCGAEYQIILPDKFVPNTSV